MPFEVNKNIEEAIEEVVTSSRSVMLGASIRDIQKAVKARLGFEPSTSTVARVLRRLGLDNTMHRHKWSWTKDEQE